MITENKDNNGISQIEAILAKQLEILQKKSFDYNGGASDPLVLFKSVGSEMNNIFQNPNVKNSTKCLLFMIKLNFESLQDNGLDLANYVTLLNLDMQ